MRDVFMDLWRADAPVCLAIQHQLFFLFFCVLLRLLVVRLFSFSILAPVLSGKQDGNRKLGQGHAEGAIGLSSSSQ